MKLHNLGLFARMGGSFDRVFFMLTILGETLDPVEVTNLLNLNPTKSYKKGDETPSGAQYRKTGAWILDSGEIALKEDESEAMNFLEWIKRLAASFELWESLSSRYEVQVRLIGYTNQMNADFNITHDIMRELSLRKLDLVVEPYLSLDEGDES